MLADRQTDRHGHHYMLRLPIGSGVISSLLSNNRYIGLKKFPTLRRNYLSQSSLALSTSIDPEFENKDLSGV